MRYYKLILSDPDSGDVVQQWSSLDSQGNTILGALNIEIDLPIYAADVPMGNASARIWGVSIQDISQAANFGPHIDSSGNLIPGLTFQLYAGMAKGLPFAQPAQSGLVLQGTVQSCFGNWQDTVQTLDFVIVAAAVGTPTRPQNISFGWPAGQTLGDMVQGALAVAYPDFQCEVTTSPQLVLNQAEPGFYQNLEQFAKYVRDVSLHILGGDGYPGVSIVVQNNKFIVSDQTQSTPTPAVISFTDLIGQPTWLTINTISFKTVMRADLAVNDVVTLPAKTRFTTTAQSYSGLRDQSIFQGNFQISSVRHIGNFRQPDGNSWVTVFEAFVPS